MSLLSCKRRSNCPGQADNLCKPSPASQEDCEGMIFVPSEAKSSRHRGHKAYCKLSSKKADKEARKLAIRILSEDDCKATCNSWVTLKHGPNKGFSYCRVKSGKKRSSHKRSKSEKRSQKKKCKRSGKVWVKRSVDKNGVKRKSHCRK